MEIAPRPGGGGGGGGAGALPADLPVANPALLAVASACVPGKGNAHITHVHACVRKDRAHAPAKMRMDTLTHTNIPLCSSAVTFLSTLLWIVTPAIPCTQGDLEAE